jgi:hypothetical protein
MKRALVAALLASSTVAFAHGGLPVSQHILRVNGGETMYVPVVYWGLWIGKAGGPWKWICEELVNGYRFRKWALSSDGMFYTTDIKGITQSSDHGCTWVAATGAIAQLHVSDVVVDPDDGATAYATTGDGGSVLPDGGIVPASNAVYVTNDRGATWTALPALAAQSSRLFTSVRVARSAPRAVYVTSNAQMSPFVPTLHRSLDGAVSFSSLPLGYTLDGAMPFSLELLAIDPRNPLIVWARAVAEVTSGGTTITRQALLRSPDGGASWSELAKVDAVMEPSGQTRGIDGIAFDVAANLTYVATRTGLLSGSDTGSNSAPTLAGTGNLAQTQCVEVHDGAVFACSSQFPPDNAAIARSTDGAHQFSSVLNYVDTIGPIDTCPAGTPVADQCPFYWYMYGAQLGIAFDGGTADLGGMPPRGHGCSYTVGAVESAVGGVALAVLLVALAIRTGARSAARARRRG